VLPVLPPPLGHGEWFVIAEGRNAGLWHMRGWVLYAQYCGPQGDPRLSEYLAHGVCPRCAAVVLTKQTGAPGDWIGREVMAHEDWHHRTDYPHPATP